MADVNPASPKPTRRQRAAQTRRRMLDAAITCFTTTGYDGTTMAQIAKQAGVAVCSRPFMVSMKVPVSVSVSGCE